MIWKFIILAIIVYIKAIFSSADTAFTYLNKAKFNQMSKHAKQKSERKILKIKEMLDHKLRLFGTTRVGITLAELFASAFAAEAFVANLAQNFERLGLNTSIQYILSVLIVTFILSYFTLVFGELLPKRIARNHPEKTAYQTVNVVYAFSKINTVFEKVLTISEKFFSNLLGIGREPSEKLTEREIKLIIEEGKDQGIFDADEKNLLYHALKFDDLRVKHVMLPREKIICWNVEEQQEKLFQMIQKYKYTRMPVYEKTKDHILGILNVKDILLWNIEKEKHPLDIKGILREPIYITKEDKLDKVFHTMQLNNKHIAMVKADTGKIEGMLTMEDILEKLVGNIIDEFDEE